MQMLHNTAQRQVQDPDDLDRHLSDVCKSTQRPRTARLPHVEFGRN